MRLQARELPPGAVGPEHDRARARADEAVDRLQQRRLAGAVRPDHGHEAAATGSRAPRRAGCRRRRSRRAARSTSRSGSAKAVRSPRRRARGTCRGRRRRPRGSARTSAGVPLAITLPSPITSTRSLTIITASMSCSIEQEGRAALARSCPDVLEQLEAERRVDPGHRLVEQDHARLGHQRPPELEQLALAARQRARVVVGQRAPGGPARAARAARVPDCALARAARAAASGTPGPSRSPGWSAAASSMLSSTLIRVSARALWNVRTSPARAIAWRGTPVDALPGERDRVRRPRGGSRRSRLNAVVLPAPFGPISAVIEPAANLRRRRRRPPRRRRSA